jgi:hypothetical protein
MVACAALLPLPDIPHSQLRTTFPAPPTPSSAASGFFSIFSSFSTDDTGGFLCDCSHPKCWSSLTFCIAPQTLSAVQAHSLQVIRSRRLTHFKHRNSSPALKAFIRVQIHQMRSYFVSPLCISYPILAKPLLSCGFGEAISPTTATTAALCQAAPR